MPNPGGRLPLVAHWYWPDPPAALNANEYGCPTAPEGNELFVVTERDAPTTASVNVRLSDEPSASETLNRI